MSTDSVPGTETMFGAWHGMDVLCLAPSATTAASSQLDLGRNCRNRLVVEEISKNSGENDSCFRFIMPRPPRVCMPGLSVHVFQRGVDRGVVFQEVQDYERLLSLIKEAATEYRVDVHGYALMTNHYHLVATPHQEDAMSNAMRDVNGQYGRYYNKKYERIGPLWNGRYGGVTLDDERYWLTCLAYVEQNPSNACIVSAPEDYRWSSYRHHAFGEPSNWLVEHALFKSLGHTAEERLVAYRAICALRLKMPGARHRINDSCQAPNGRSVPGTD